MRRRLKTPEGKGVSAKRKRTVEMVFGIIKAVMGFRQFLLRGLQSVLGEWDLVCIAYNLKRLHTLAPAGDNGDPSQRFKVKMAQYGLNF